MDHASVLDLLWVLLNGGHSMSTRNLQTTLCVAIAAAVFGSMSAFAQAPVFYPAKKQSAQQQSKDTAECKTWAKQTTGIDPAAPPPAPVTASGPAVGGGERVRGAARGA